MSKVYLPTYTSSNCIVIKDKDTIRVYDNFPVQDALVSYTDYYINSHYLENKGSELIEIVPECISSDKFTDDYHYRNDYSEILIITFILSIIVLYLPLKVFSKLFGRWLRV